PCSGLGTIRRDPDIKWRRGETDLAPLAAAQREMLRQAALAVRPGGRLVYATCSSEPEENEDVVEAFLAEHPRASRVPIEGARFVPFVDARGDFRTLPHRDGLEAFYAAILAL
ncbi:MAG: SAM-dependent methyltransferase, partial [Acidobacteria bacterium]|nr:SAM-dependent methyltransferase [Acidobacteriota bacterium]